MFRKYHHCSVKVELVFDDTDLIRAVKIKETGKLLKELYLCSHWCKVC